VALSDKWQLSSTPHFSMEENAVSQSHFPGC
jgi:hypothetical protein